MAVEEVDFEWERAKEVRRILGKCLGNAFETHGKDLAGFAIVTWDMRGNCHSSYSADTGMVGESLIPILAHDALNRHLAVAIAGRARPEEVKGDN